MSNPDPRDKPYSPKHPRESSPSAERRPRVRFVARPDGRGATARPATPSTPSQADGAQAAKPGVRPAAKTQTQTARGSKAESEANASARVDKQPTKNASVSKKPGVLHRLSSPPVTGEGASADKWIVNAADVLEVAIHLAIEAAAHAVKK